LLAFGGLRDGAYNPGDSSSHPRVKKGEAMNQPHHPSQRAKLLADAQLELQKAHRIIHNALGLMTPEQRLKWSAANYRAGLIDIGTTRANEREQILRSLAREVA
jgi:hypothetical protein